MARLVLTEGLVVNQSFAGISHKTMKYKVHLATCRYVNDSMYPMQEMVLVWGNASVRTKIMVGIVTACATCKPTLLKES